MQLGLSQKKALALLGDPQKDSLSLLIIKKLAF